MTERRKSFPFRPGIPAAGHVTTGGHWHPGRAETCVKCEIPDPPRRRDSRDEGAQEEASPM